MANSGRSTRNKIALPSCSTFPAGYKSPVSPWSTSSRRDPRSDATTGRPPGIGFENRLAKGFICSRGQDGEARRGDHVVQDFAADMADKFHVSQMQFVSQAFEFGSLRPIAGNLELDLRQMLHRPQEVGNSFFGRQAAEVENRRVRCSIWRSLRGQFLEMGKNSNLLCAETILDEFLSGETAGSQELIDTLPVSSQPTMEIGFGHQQQHRTRGP